MRLDWRGLITWEWPLAGLLLLALALDGAAASEMWPYDERWELPSSLTLCALALLASRWPVLAGLGVSLVLLVWSVVIRLADVALLSAAGGLLGAEFAAVLAVIVAVVRRSSRPAAAGVVGLTLFSCLAVRVLRPEHPGSPQDLGWAAVLPVLAVLAGWYLRTRDARHSRERRAVVVAAQLRERVALARELHDVVAHHIGGMVVQAQAAQAVAVPDPGAPARVLPVIERAGADALSAMQRMVTTLQDIDEGGGQPATPTTDLVADLHAVTATPAGGTLVRLTVELAEPVPAEVATTVLRLVQESVTNARRYATDAQEITATVRAGGGTVRVQVRDDGRHTDRPRRSGGGGYGLIGMRERVQLLGGRFEAGRLPDAGWQVLADLPLRAG
ncbi:Signal transduction histidine kinase [Micromonospora haikouensis]|uniref:histidine kinase n=1 Tax=Micromonospora haikouensis TaxID=686309 RepID=A0A1C4WWJ8_9ACTN|nr:histidine kinase [Micromonospora haikouensis]SCF00605.1 Signal transduction histidine kinase [Micromonospora haikouensis]